MAEQQMVTTSLSTGLSLLPSPGPNVTEKLVVYVGNDAAQYAQLRESLSPSDFQVEWTRASAMRIEELIADWYRVLLLDLDSPSQDGYDILRTIKAHHANIPVVLLGDPRDLHLTKVGLVRLEGADALLLKPISDAALLTQVVGDAFRRLDRWKCIFNQLAQLRIDVDDEAEARQHDVTTRISSLSTREREVMQLLVEGKHTKAIATDLSLSPKTIEHHRSNILRKMQVDSVVELVRVVLTS